MRAYLSASKFIDHVIGILNGSEVEMIKICVKNKRGRERQRHRERG